ncbi:MAG TPA: MBL fold metallo-hydrolase [Candidatus Binatia bacterium]|jgi:ribonuclease BN (tRNA processing enzyme)
MKLHILGCGDAFGSGGRNQSGYLIESSAGLFLLDCGPTTLLGLKKAGIDPRRIDAVFLSHLHGDHFGGLPFLFIEYLFQRKRDKPLEIAGPLNTEKRVRDLFQIMYGEGNAPRELPPARFHILNQGASTRVGNVEIFAFRVPHQVKDVSLALKLTCDGKRLLFSGDSSWTDAFVDHAAGVDLFLCECTFYEPQDANHVNYRELQTNLPRLTCKRLLLTHLGEEMLFRRDEIALDCADDGMIVEF